MEYALELKNGEVCLYLLKNGRKMGDVSFTWEQAEWLYRQIGQLVIDFKNIHKTDVSKREEQMTKISEHFDELHAIVSDYGLNVPNDINDALKAAYLAGADYALDMFAPRWISVQDELPMEHEWILGFSLKRSYIDIYNFDSNGLIEAHGITHWMHLSPPPIITSSKKGGAE